MNSYNAMIWSRKERNQMPDCRELHAEHPNIYKHQKEKSSKLTITLSYLSLCVFPWSVDEVHREDLHTQASLNTIHYDLQPFTVPDHEACMVQLISDLFEVQIGVLTEHRGNDD